MNYYNRWPSPSLPPTLKKIGKTENKGLRLDAGDYDLDDGSKGVTIIAPSDDDDSEIRFQSVSSSNNNNSNHNNNNNKKTRKMSASNGTLDRIDLGMNRQGMLDSMSLNSVPVIVNNNNNKKKINLNQSTNNMNRSSSRYEHREPPRLHDSFR